MKFSKNGNLIAVASTDKNVYLLVFEENDYVALAACYLQTDKSFPVAVNFSADSSKVVICTNQRRLMMLDPYTQQFIYKFEEVKQTLWTSWIGRYPLITKSTNTGMISVCLGNNSNLVASGDENGTIYLWKSIEDIKENVGLNLSGHTSHIQRIELTVEDKRLLSIGLTDQTLC